MDYSIQKAVELGVKNSPIATERRCCQTLLEAHRKALETWQNIVISACEQCGRATIPQVLAPTNLINRLVVKPILHQLRLAFCLTPLA